MPTYYTYRDDVPLQRGQTLAFETGKGYYAAGTPQGAYQPTGYGDFPTGGSYSAPPKPQPQPASYYYSPPSSSQPPPSSLSGDGSQGTGASSDAASSSSASQPAPASTAQAPHIRSAAKAVPKPAPKPAAPKPPPIYRLPSQAPQSDLQDPTYYLTQKETTHAAPGGPAAARSTPLVSPKRALPRAVSRGKIAPVLASTTDARPGPLVPTPATHHSLELLSVVDPLTGSGLYGVNRPLPFPGLKHLTQRGVRLGLQVRLEPGATYRATFDASDVLKVTLPEIHGWIRKETDLHQRFTAQLHDWLTGEATSSAEGVASKSGRVAKRLIQAESLLEKVQSDLAVAEQLVGFISVHHDNLPAYEHAAINLVEQVAPAILEQTLLGSTVTSLLPLAETYIAMVVYRPLADAAEAFLRTRPDPALQHPTQSSFYLDVLFHATWTGHYDPPPPTRAVANTGPSASLPDGTKDVGAGEQTVSGTLGPLGGRLVVTGDSDQGGVGAIQPLKRAPEESQGAPPKPKKVLEEIWEGVKKNQFLLWALSGDRVFVDPGSGLGAYVYATYQAPSSNPTRARATPPLLA